MCSNLSSFCLLHQAKMEIFGYFLDGWSIWTMYFGGNEGKHEPRGGEKILKSS